MTPRVLRPLAWSVFLLVVLAGGARAQSGADSTDIEALTARARANESAVLRLPVQSGPIDPAGYRLGPGDGLSLELSGRVTRRIPVVVDTEGLINVPEVGVLPVGGHTLADVRSRVLPRLRAAYPGVRVDLRLLQLRTFKVYVSGMVKSSGVAEATGSARASELLVGPFTLGDGASRRNIELRHSDGTRERVDLDAFNALGRLDHNPYLRDGDQLLVPPLKRRVWSYGALGRPGEFELVDGDSIGALLELSAGLRPGAEPKDAVLYRFRTPGQADSIAIDLTSSADLQRLLEDRDRLFVRENSDYRRPRNISIIGEVVFPGSYAIQEGRDRVLDVMQRAGGLTASAARGRIQVFRPVVATSSRRDIEFERLSRLSRSEMTDAEYQTFRTKLAAQDATYVFAYDDLLREGTTSNVLLKDGDILLVDRESQAVRVDGNVIRPSLIEYVPGRTLDEYITLAGGYADRAWKGKVRVTRAGLNQTLYSKDVKVIEPGDFIWVPEKNDFHFWAVFKDAIIVAGAAATIILVVRQ